MIDTVVRTGDGEFAHLAEAPLSGREVLGAVLMSIAGADLLTSAEWDDLDSLWAYLVQALESCLDTGAGETYFPDQAILFQVERLPTQRLLVSVSYDDVRRAATARAGEFTAALAAAGAEFFGRRGRNGREAAVCNRWAAEA